MLDFAFFRSLGFSNKKTVALLKVLQDKGLVELILVPQDNKKSKVAVTFSPELLNLMISDTARAISNTDLAELFTQEEKKESAEPDSFEVVKALKLKYPIHPENRYFKHFQNGHKLQFLKTFAARVDKDKITLEQLEHVFQKLAEVENYSLADMFNSLLSANYKIFDVLFDFIWIQVEAKISSISVESRGRKALLDWINNGTTTLAEIEDCWLFMLQSEINYSLSLISLSKALQQFQKFRVELPDGRFGWKKKVDNRKESAYHASMSNLNKWAQS